MTAKEPEKKHHHNFTEHELDMMLYFWDKNATAVHEYMFMKNAWKQPPSEIDAFKKDDSLRHNAVDAGHRTNVDLTKTDPDEEDIVYLNLPRDKVHVVEFYASWCAHCIHMRESYIKMAAEVTSRSIGTPVQFHAVSCELFRMICRAYSIKGFPVVLGYRLGANLHEAGILLNPIHGSEMTVGSIARDLHLELAYAPKEIDTLNFTNSEDRREYEERQLHQADEAAATKQAWHEYSSSMDERYHNAAVSLAFVLKNGVYVQRRDGLDDNRALALKEFLELVDWATPQAWSIRTGLIQDLLHNLPEIVSGYRKLTEIVDRHVAIDAGNSLWGGFQESTAPSNDTVSLADFFRNNTRWTEACTHSQRSMGYTCGMWDLFHIISIGTSLPSHQLYGFLSGYLTSPTNVAEILKRFVSHFFACEVCRINFIENFDNCGQNHCERLATIMPALQEDDSSNELAKWLMEMHNSVNTRLMMESAQRHNRIVTEKETLSAMFPTVNQCPDCWKDAGTMVEYDSHATVSFLKGWYWPSEESPHVQFKAVLQRRHLGITNNNGYAFDWDYLSWAPHCLFGTLLVLLLRGLIRRKPRNSHMKYV
jgi:thiol-disulfide isomerase/thioredoxin